MTEFAAEASVTPESRGRLIASLAELASNAETRVYAVIEGALVRNLSGRLADADIAHRSLYRDAKPELRAGGPWLASPYHYHLTDEDLYEPVGENSIRRKAKIVPRPADPNQHVMALLEIVTDSRAAVFWIGGASLSEERLYQHLRTINRIVVPTMEGSPFRTEQATFRHADANVMTQIMPVLHEEQHARFLGPAQGILFTPHEHWGGGVRRVVRPSEEIARSAGFLTLSAEQVEHGAGIRMLQLRRRIAVYLREVAPAKTRSLTDEQLKQLTGESMQEAQELGVTTDLALAKWSYIRMVGTFDGHWDKVKNFMMDGSVSEDGNRRVEYLMGFRLQQLRGH